ncbi:MAG TPA: NHL repeat-containing protein [Solirubrobacteraceae bacterium]|nr:NHL repeat-containing protein [Solirubrobacteraceae bacterium]
MMLEEVGSHCEDGRWLISAAAKFLVVLVAGVCTWCTPAFALSQRGHVFDASFASKGAGAGELLRPTGIAVNEASGDVYVVDTGNNRLERFSASGDFISAWGWGVSDGKSEFEVCTNGCKAGVAGEGVAQFDAPEAIAVDNSGSAGDPSRGDVYVLSDTVAADSVVEKFSGSGQPLGEVHVRAGAWGALGGVAVDGSGGLWITDIGASPEEVLGFSDALQNSPVATVRLPLECAETPGLAVDGSGEAFYVAHQLASVLGECPELPASAKAPAVIAAVNGAGEVLREALDFENASGVAVDEASASGSPLGAAARGDVFVDNGTSVAVFGPNGALVQRFGEGQLTAGTGVAVDSATGDVLVADAKANQIDVFEAEAAGLPSVDGLFVNNTNPTAARFEARVDPHGSDTQAFFEVGTADCRATPADCVDVPALAGEDLGSGFGAQPVSVVAEGLSPGTRYFLRAVAVNEHGEADEESSFGSFTSPPAAGAGLADGREWELVSPAEKSGALIYPIAGTTENGGPASGVIEAAADGQAITYAANGAFGEGVVGNRSLEATQVVSTRGPDGWSTRDITTANEAAKGLQPGAAQEYRWFSPDLSEALAQPFGPFRLTGSHMQEPPLVAGVQSEERGLYVRNTQKCESTFSGCFEALVTSPADTAGSQFGGELEFRGAAPDLRHVVFSSDVALSSTEPSAPGLYEWSAGEPAGESLQLVSVLPSGKKAASDEPEAQLGDFNPAGSSTRGAVSADGSRVFWSAIVEEGGVEVTRLFMRETTTGRTIVINAAQGTKEPSVEERALEEVHFLLANGDGSRVFFTDTFPLTAESKLRPSEQGEGVPADLYVCEVILGASGPECDLKDLTVDPGFDVGETADVVGTLPGASEDGSWVYFVANGVLSEEARAAGALPGGCASPNAQQAASPDATCNLYVEHYSEEAGGWEPPRFIAVLSQEDQPDWGGTGSFSLDALTSRVSPNGRFLAFMSKQSLTGYDNLDESEAAHGARDEEVYVYDAQQRTLVCASCDPSGAQPHGVFDHEASGEGKGLLVDRLGVWKETEGEEHGGGRRAVDHWLAGLVPGWTPIEEGTAFYQSRYLSDEGQLFFDSPADLVPAATNGREDVYEYEPQGLGSCQLASGCVALLSSGESLQETAFMDASETGDDVFFLTSQPLTSQVHETSFNVYDARACSQQSPCSSPPPGVSGSCETLETCRPASLTVHVFSGASGTATLAGQAEQSPGVSQVPSPKTTVKLKPLTRAQKLAKALKTCRVDHKHSKRKRRACERQARTKYASKADAKRPSAKRGRR